MRTGSSVLACSLVVGIAAVLTSAPSRAVSPASAAAAVPSARCETTAIYHSCCEWHEIICLNPCAFTCSQGFETEIPTYGTAYSCGCAGGSGPTCCHLAMGYDAGGMSFNWGVGPCRGTSCSAGNVCDVNYEPIDDHTGNLSAQCETH